MAGIGSDGDAVMDGRSNQLIERFAGLEILAAYRLSQEGNGKRKSQRAISFG
jgi:hypothetical protein